MRFTSLHNHTSFCDGRDDVETMCRAAWEKGLAAVGFSAHGPIGRKTGFKTNWHLPDERLEEYMAAVQAARQRWEGRLPVYLGLEVDYIRGLVGPADKDIQELGLDYIIASVHYIIPPGKAGPFTVDGPGEELEQGIREGFGGDGEAMMAHYWDAVQEMISAGGFDILGHVDLVKKNNAGGRWFNPESENYRRKAGETAAAAARAGVVVEVNTGGINRKKITETYPSFSILRLFGEHQVPAIITADAHRAEDIDGHYQTGRETLLAAGYTRHLIFEGKKSGRPAWTAEPL
ncbi:MAG: histidinol-phosphatase [Treponema sp.]|jgi:histidinol-phosphatase (PHP family)|nr:histidinol-phosphatase [Treponema sp.]